MTQESIKMKGFLTVIMIPIGVFLFCVFFEIGNTFYWQKRLDNDTARILSEALETESIKEVSDYEVYAKKKYDLEGYNSVKISVNFQEDGDQQVVILSNQIEHFSVTGYISYVIGKAPRETKFTVSRYSGYLNDYSEPVVTKLVNTQEEDDKVYTDEELKEMEDATSTTRRASSDKGLPS